MTTKLIKRVWSEEYGIFINVFDKGKQVRTWKPAAYSSQLRKQRLINKKKETQ